jgi:hypothetical protein
MIDARDLIQHACQNCVNHVSQSSNGLLHEKHVRKKLENFVETPPETSRIWMKLDEHKKHNGNCLAPSDRPLHGWVHTQKQRVLEHETNKESDNRCATLTVDQRNRLTKLGVVGHDLTSRMQHFKNRLSEHATCIQANDRAVDVPPFENCTSLCSWVESQMTMCQIPGFGASGKTSGERLQLFESAGINLNTFSNCGLTEHHAGHP